MNITEIFDEVKTANLPGPDEHTYVRACLRMHAFRVHDEWIDRLSLDARSVYRGRITEITDDATEFLLLRRDLKQTMDERVCFANDYGTWAEIVGVESDAQAIRKTIAKLDATWAICEPLLKAFLAEYKPAVQEEGIAG